MRWYIEYIYRVEWQTSTTFIVRFAKRNKGLFVKGIEPITIAFKYKCDTMAFTIIVAPNLYVSTRQRIKNKNDLQRAIVNLHKKLVLFQMQLKFKVNY